MGLDRIGVQQLREMLAGSSPPVVVNVRAPWHYDAGHIPGARNASTGHGPAASEGVPVGRLIVMYCDMKHKAKVSQEYRCERVAGLTAARGHRGAVLEGGFPAWRRARLPIEPTQP